MYDFYFTKESKGLSLVSGSKSKALVSNNSWKVSVLVSTQIESGKSQSLPS